MKTLMVCWSLLILQVGGTVMLGESPENAQGKLTVNGKTTELRYAYARERNDVFEPKVREVRVVLSDVPIEVFDLEDNFAVGELGKQGKVHGIEIRFDLKGELRGEALIHEASGNASTTWLGQDNFEPKEFNAKTVAGKLTSNKPFTIVDLTIEDAVTFSAPVQPDSKPTAEGAAAAASGPGKVMIEYMRAVRAADMPALKRVCTEASYKQIEALPQDHFKEAAAEEMPAGTKLVREFESGDRARVETQDSTGVAKWTLVRINNEWKMQL